MSDKITSMGSSTDHIVDFNTGSGGTNQNRRKCAKACVRFLKTNLLSLLTIMGVFLGIILGFILKSAKSEWTQREITYVAFFGDIFLRMLKGLILPLIISSLVAAIGSLDMSLSGKIGGRAIVYYLSTTICAVILGIILVNVIRPGINDKHHLVANNQTVSRKVLTVDTLLDLVKNMFAPNLVQACIEQVNY